ncbi:hypothetical protein [Daejeonella sp.]|uniref:hypothetical protein n=1 Tax=Daejeonella sp. TaxID=2805397 RepID=UPI0030C370E8
MAKCNISIDFSGEADELLRSAEQAISGAGGSFAGNNSDGNFAISSPLGKVSGTYKVVGQSFNISIVDKPFLVSCNKIEEELRKQMKIKGS